MQTTKKLFNFSILAFTVIALSGCGGSSTQQQTAANNQSRVIDNTEFTMTIPREWDVIESKDFTSDVPPETIIVVRNNVKNENFTANVNIVRRNLQATEASLDFAKEVINRQKTGLLNYKEDKNETAKIQIAGKPNDTYLETFEGKKDAQSDLIDFYQTYAVKGNYAYIVTGSYSPQETNDNINTVQTIVKSFTLK